jgi:hypothetical protein
MVENFYSRTKLLLGEDGINKLKESKVAIFGIGRSWLFCGRRTSKSWSTKFYINRP